MKTLGLAIVILWMALLSPSKDFYVAPNGNDAWSGTQATPNRQHTDGPFATLERARDEVRRLKSGSPLQVPVSIHLRGGTYRIEKTIEFTAEDSGTEQAPITYSAYAGEQPVISGGRQITGWQKGTDSLWHTTVPGVKEGAWCFHQLFVNGERRTRARTPNQGYLYTADPLAPIDHEKWQSDTPAKHGFYFRDQDIRRWQHLDDALVVIYHAWTSSLHFITELDTTHNLVRLVPASTRAIGYFWEYNTRYQVENVFEALDEPGEWYLDRHTGVLSYWPMPGEHMPAAEVIAPVVSQTLIAFKGEPAAGRFVEHIRFRGIVFEHTDSLIGPDMPTDQQGATERQSLIAAEGLRHATFENCEISHAGENGIWLDSGSSDNVIRHCDIHDLGGGGVFVGPKAYAEKPEMLVQRNVVDNNFIHDGSQVFHGSQGVWIGQSSYNDVTHNEISDFHHVGISVGHSWGYEPTTAHDNLIAFNHMHHICNGYFSDGGGIYTLGISPRTVIRNNIVYDVVPTPLMPVGGFGIYLDEGSTGIVVENNIVYRVGAGAFNQHYGRENLTRNNIFAFGGHEPITCTRPEEHLSFTFERNIVLSTEGQATSGSASPLKCKTEFRRNLYWDTSGKEPLFSGVSFAEWQQSGRDRDSQIADPQFYDAEHFDFRLKKSSPALALGFQEIATDRVGLYGDRQWVDAPSKIKRSPLPTLPPPPLPPPMFEDFESTASGQRPAGYRYYPEDRPELIQVTEEAAATGKKSLKFTKVEGLANSWEPHLYFSGRLYKSGRVRFACDILNDPSRPAELQLGLRDYTHGTPEYLEGPSLVMKADGNVVAAGKLVTRVPLGKWVHLEIQLNLDQTTSTPRTYRLAVTVAGETEQVFTGLPYLHPAFEQLTWFGFSDLGKPGAVFYVDNIRLEPIKE